MFIEIRRSNCLRTTSCPSSVLSTNQLPGQAIDPDAQCRIFRDSSASVFCRVRVWRSVLWTYSNLVVVVVVVVVVVYMASQKHASVSQGRICWHNCKCCHTETEVVHQTCYLTHSGYRDTVPTGSSTNHRTPDAWQFVCWLLNVPPTCECISGTDLLRHFYVLPH